MEGYSGLTPWSLGEEDMAAEEKGRWARGMEGTSQSRGTSLEEGSGLLLPRIVVSESTPSYSLNSFLSLTS